MSGTLAPADRSALRWGAGAAAAALLHATAIVLLLSHAATDTLQPAPPEAIMLDIPAEQAATPAETPPQPEAVPRTEAEAALLPRVDPAPLPVPPAPGPLPPELPDPDPPLAPEPAEVALPIPPPAPKPKPHPRRPAPHQAASRPTPRDEAPLPQAAAPATQAPAAQAPAAQAAERAAPSAPSANPAAAASWRSVLLGRLQSAKRFPDRARLRGDQGVAVTTFTMDRTGRVLSASLVRSSGSALLDEEAVALIRRAEPLPPPPAEVAGATVTLTVPINFALR